MFKNVICATKITGPHKKTVCVQQKKQIRILEVILCENQNGENQCAFLCEKIVVQQRNKKDIIVVCDKRAIDVVVRTRSKSFKNK